MGAYCNENLSLPTACNLSPSHDLRLSKHVHDNVHGNIYLDPLSLKFIDTEQFQRLASRAQATRFKVGIHDVCIKYAFTATILSSLLHAKVCLLVLDLNQLHFVAFVLILPKFVQGMTHMVYPGAVHSRFEHSLGVYWLAGEAIHKLKTYQGLELGIDRFDVQTVKIAGLLHDVGHGPFSHLFEREFLPQVLNGFKCARQQKCLRPFQARHTPGAPKSAFFFKAVISVLSRAHEQMSAKLIDHIVDVHHIDVEAEMIKRVKELILASSEFALPKVSAYFYDPFFRHILITGNIFSLVLGKCMDVVVSCLYYYYCYYFVLMLKSAKEKQFLYDIVANGRNGIDVDKFDYIYRDSRACGLGCSFDFQRLMETMRVLGDEICYRAKDYLSIHKLFATRADLYRTVYTHSKVKAVEIMVVDALLKANSYLEISSSIQDPSEYWKLDDTIIKTIETAPDEELRESRDLIRRIRRRNLYQFCNEFAVPKDKLEHFKNVTAQDIACSQKNGGVLLKEEDIAVSNVRIDLTRGRQNPLERCSFLTELISGQDYESEEKFPIPDGRISHLLPTSYQDMIVRVYSKKPELIAAVSEAFENFQLKTYGVKAQVHATPEKKKRRL
ncbi:HD domain-containing metal-dependent phosphohydrolase family protein isoform 1 [Theobroma cacao]|uniref:HD domain-containing metal-dependent phosphohydrolase family protein isoform 1 n=1 Tax=Theobroma cacao TaxID=3641 RepID=A0A061EBJ9_THECC|nr:HD domain-containing metal-dependent phosphohydrolase family protein isoform 1 [Theobroma cacao]